MLKWTYWSVKDGIKNHGFQNRVQFLETEISFIDSYKAARIIGSF